MKKILLTLIFGFFATIALADDFSNPSNYAQFQIKNNTNVNITVQFIGPKGWNKQTSSCVFHLPIDGGKYFLAPGTSTDLMVQDAINVPFTDCAHKEGLYFPALYQIQVSDLEGQSATIYYFNPYHSGEDYRQNVCVPQSKSCYLQMNPPGGPLQDNCFPFSIYPSNLANPGNNPTSIKIGTTNYMVTLNIYNQARNGSCDPHKDNYYKIVFTINYAPMQLDTTIKNTSGFDVGLSYPAKGKYNPATAPSPVKTGNTEHVNYVTSLKDSNQQNYLTFNYGADSCSITYNSSQCNNGKCSVGANANTNNKYILCWVDSSYTGNCPGNFCTVPVSVANIQNFTVKMTNTSGKQVYAQYTPVFGRYLPENQDPPSPTATIFTYVPQWNTNSTAMVTYTSKAGQCTYSYGISGGNCLANVDKSTGSDFSCSVSKIIKNPNGTCSANFDITPYSPHTRS